MSEEDRAKVTTHINGDDAPSLAEWLPGGNGRTLSKEALHPALLLDIGVCQTETPHRGRLYNRHLSVHEATQLRWVGSPMPAAGKHGESSTTPSCTNRIDFAQPFRLYFH